MQNIIIIGGGLAGLSLAILCAKSGYNTTLLEKGAYPKHKVCGEYISMESYDFVQSLGVPLSELGLPKITNFVLTSHHNLSANCGLEMGGFGISRYLLDELLAKAALENGVKLLTEQRVTSVDFEEKTSKFQVKTQKSAELSMICIVTRLLIMV